jgi:uncharacterized membrane protein HdeD (DUF308 family)
MDHRSLKFSLKVWLTSVFIAPAIFIIANTYVESFNKHTSYRDYFSPGDYLFIFFFELISTFVLWLLFWGIIELVLWYCHNQQFQRWLIFIPGLLLTAIIPLLLADPGSILNFNNFMFIPMMANMLCIGSCCWIYKL